MSFQGDVAGIGLGELLQSLARGGQDGVLRLFGPDASSVLGVKGGLLFLLPGPDEDEDELRLRCQRAWADDADPQFETKRRGDIATARRLETLYALIQSPNVHFRFEPGRVPLPEVSGPNPLAPEASVPWAQGLAVEYVLLEHARLSDEAQDGASRIAPYDIPRILDIQAAPEAAQEFLEHCTGRSTMRELSDRLGWTLLQTTVSVHEYVRAGILRLAEPRELLVAAQYELGQKRTLRGVHRLTAWIENTPPGPPFTGDAELILAEWQEGELVEALPAMEPRTARALLRKLDLADPNRESSIQRWEALRQAHRRDNVTAVHLAAFRLEEGGLQESAALNDFLRLMRTFEEEGKLLRAQALLRMATTHVPESHKARIELATQMLALGMQEHGIAWLLDVARDLIDKHRGERAAGPLREVLREAPGHPEAVALLQEAQQQGLRRRRRKVHFMVASAVTVVLGAIATVHYRAQRDYERRMALVTDALEDPREALARLDEHFAGDESPRVSSLRTSLRQRRIELEDALYEEWISLFEAVKDECELGDPLLGLERTLELPPPPELQGTHRGFPARSEILNVLANRLADLVDAVDPTIDATPDELESEARLVRLLEDALERSGEHVGQPEVEAFHVRLSEIHAALEGRRDERDREREALAQRELEEQQDLLLAAARAHAKEGALERAMGVFDRLTAIDETDELATLLKDEIDAVRTQLDAVGRARELAAAGEHEAAIAELEAWVKTPEKQLLPWRVTTSPEGARVTLSDGSVRRTPFVMETAPGVPLSLRFELAGHEPHELQVEEPRDVSLNMHRTADRTWRTGNRIDAAPVPTGADHLVADRHGRVGRLTADGSTRWIQTLETISGIARTPVFLPRRPGHALIISEDGQAWLIDAATGAVEGPWSHGQPPVEGPTLTRHGISVRFADGQIALWTDRLEPAVYEAMGTYLSSTGSTQWNSREDALPSNLSVARRSAEGSTQHRSPWTPWVIETREDEYRVWSSETDESFTVEREGDWSYVGWEAPNSVIPDGRLWVSDEAGLRAFLPHRSVIARSDDRGP